MPHSPLQPAFDASIATIPPSQRFSPATILCELKNQLRNAPGLLTCSTTGLLDIIPYPCDSEGVAVPIRDLPAYTQTHVFPDEIHCFCGVSRGTAGGVRIFKSKYILSEHFGCICIGCADWKPSSDVGCSYFLNLTRHFQATIPTPLKAYPLRASNIPIVAPTPVQPPPPPPALGDPFGLPPRPPITPPGPPRVLSPLGLTPGFLCDAERLYTPPPPSMVSLSVQDRTRWPDPIEAEQTILSLINPASPGTSYTKLVSSLGHCFVCGRVMALHVILNHYCLPLAEEDTSSAREGDRIFGKDLPFGIGLPTAPANIGAAGSSASCTAPMGAAPMPATPVNYEDGDMSSGSINRSRKRVLIPADHKKLDKWIDKYYDQLEGLQPGLALAIAAGTPRGIKGPLLVDSNDKLYIGSPRPLKRKYPDPDQLSESEGGEGGDADSSVEDSEDDDSLSKKGKGVKRPRLLGWGERKSDGEGHGDHKGDSEGKGKGNGDGDGEDGGCGGTADAGEVPVKEEDVGDVPCPLGREGSFTTKDGKMVTFIDLTDD